VVDALTSNLTLLQLDLRMTGCSPELMHCVQTLLARNRQQANVDVSCDSPSPTQLNRLVSTSHQCPDDHSSWRSPWWRRRAAQIAMICDVRGSAIESHRQQLCLSRHPLNTLTAVNQPSI